LAESHIIELNLQYKRKIGVWQPV